MLARFLVENYLSSKMPHAEVPSRRNGRELHWLAQVEITQQQQVRPIEAASHVAVPVISCSAFRSMMPQDCIILNAVGSTMPIDEKRHHSSS